MRKEAQRDICGERGLISIFLPNLRGGGAERVCIDLARAFKSFGHDVEFVLNYADGDFLAEARREFPIFDLKTQNIRNALFPLSRYLTARKPSVLIANMWPLTSIAVVSRALSSSPTRLLLVEHTTASTFYASWGTIHNFVMRSLIKLTYRHAEYIAAVSAGAAQDMAKLSGLGSNNVSVLYNPIPRRRPPSTAEIGNAERVWQQPKGRRILAVGNIKREKNYPLLLKAFANMKFSDARLVVLGGGDWNDLERLASDLGISGRITFAGFHTDPSPFYATADVFVLTSDFEGFGNVIVEALSHGLSVVATDCPFGPSEILDAGRWGWLVPVGDFCALASSIEDAISSPRDPTILKKRAQDFSPELMAKKYIDLMGL
jgi:glycosyltransferase involved in cell wall biosynthesis